MRRACAVLRCSAPIRATSIEARLGADSYPDEVPVSADPTVDETK